MQCVANLGQIDETRFQNVLNQVFQGLVSLGTESAMCQLSYESITIAIAAIKQRVEQKDDEVLPPQERDERLRRISDASTGFEVKGQGPLRASSLSGRFVCCNG